MDSEKKGATSRRVVYLREEGTLRFEVQVCRFDPHARHRHFHPERALAFIREGTSRTVLGTTEHLLGPGMLVHFPPGTPHSCDPQGPSSWRYDMLWFLIIPYGHPRDRVFEGWRDTGLVLA